MASLQRMLPKPSRSGTISPPPAMPRKDTLQVAKVGHGPPPYGSRKGWIPRTARDFGDGGAFPEIAVAQFPLDKNWDKKSSNAVALKLDSEGKVKYDMIARQGHGKDKIVHTKYSDLVGRSIDENDPELQRPDEETVKETMEVTRRALNRQVEQKVAAALPVRHADKQAPTQYIRYTPAQQGTTFNSGAKQRIIRMVETQKDPMEPPKFKVNKKIPRGPPSPPAPVLHSPNRKVTAKEQQDWKIPPCISNWKNARGYTIPLDKRLAADGRGLQSVHINENFAKLAEAMYIADRKVRESIELRAQMEKKVASKEKERKEENLKQLAQKAREDRAGIRARDPDKDEEVVERDQIRKEREKDRQRDRNIMRAAPDKRTKLQRDKERDISEKIALGLPKAKQGQELEYDQRLFNQSKGLDSGFKPDDDVYDVYDQPWRKTQNMEQSVYRPSRNADSDVYGEDIDSLIKTSRFVPDKTFSGAANSQQRAGPVQFEREEEDPFGIDKFLTEAKKGTKRATDKKDYDDQRSSKKKRDH